LVILIKLLLYYAKQLSGAVKKQNMEIFLSVEKGGSVHEFNYKDSEPGSMYGSLRPQYQERFSKSYSKFHSGYVLVMSESQFQQMLETKVLDKTQHHNPMVFLKKEMLLAYAPEAEKYDSPSVPYEAWVMGDYTRQTLQYLIVREHKTFQEAVKWLKSQNGRL
jgi:hypothetical protein